MNSLCNYTIVLIYFVDGCRCHSRGLGPIKGKISHKKLHP